MDDFTISMDWQDDDGIRGAELSATMASLCIRVRGQAITQVLDHRARTVRDSVYVPLYPLAEWLAANWWFLASEIENPNKRNDREFHRRHGLGTSSDGYAFPGIEVVSSGTRTQIRWGGESSEWTKVDFLNNGQAWLNREEFLSVSSDFIDTVIRRLSEFNVQGTFLQEEWGAIQRADEEEVSFCEAAAGLGWDPYDLDPERGEQVLQIANDLGDLLSEAIPVMDASDAVREASSILRAIQEAEPNGLSLRSIRSVVEEEGHPDGLPWEVGYRLARRARSSLQLDGEPIPSWESLANAIGEDANAVKSATHAIPALNQLPLVDGVVGLQDDDVFRFGLRRAWDSGRRFLFCRALGEAITSHGNSLVTKGHTERQQCNRAFAAEFLVPASALRERIVRDVVEAEELEELGEEFGVSTQVIAHQVQNHGIADLSNRLLNNG